MRARIQLRKKLVIQLFSPLLALKIMAQNVELWPITCSAAEIDPDHGNHWARHRCKTWQENSIFTRLAMGVSEGGMVYVLEGGCNLKINGDDANGSHAYSAHGSHSAWRMRYIGNTSEFNIPCRNFQCQLRWKALSVTRIYSTLIFPSEPRWPCVLAL
jgi:hypothetical protein